MVKYALTILISAVSLNATTQVKLDVENYLSFWEFFYDIVYVEEDYEHALVAASYASLINAPLIIA